MITEMAEEDSGRPVVKFERYPSNHFHNGTVRSTLGGRSNVLGTETRYGLESLEIEFRWGLGFPHSSRPARDTPNLSRKGYRVSFPEVRRPERGGDHPLPPSGEVKERVQLWIYSPLAFTVYSTVKFALHLSPQSSVLSSQPSHGHSSKTLSTCDYL
jgi:hypothetical protein